jgi:hypothetical protein
MLSTKLKPQYHSIRTSVIAVFALARNTGTHDLLIWGISLKTDIELASIYQDNTTTKMSTNSAIMNVRNIDVSRITFSIGKATAGRNPSINIKYDGQNLQLRLPRMKFGAGIMIRENEQNDSKTYSLFGSLGESADKYAKERSTATDDMSKFYNFLLDLEERIVQAALENSTAWFKKKRSEEAIRDSFKKLLRVSVDKQGDEYVPNGKYPPSVTIKVPVYDNRVSSEFIDNKGNPLTVYPSSLPAVFPKGVEANLVVSGSIYNVNGSFGVTWRLSYAQVFPQQKLTAVNVFADDLEEDDASPVVEAPVPESQPLLTSAETALDIEVPDLDAEPPAPQAAPAPAPAGRRRRVVATE